MPALSMFYGIIVRMQSEKGGKHSKPHIHALYGEEEIIVSLNGEVLEGKFPNRQLKMLLAWMTIHEDELFPDSSIKIMEQNKEDMKMLRPTATSVRAEEGYILDVEFDNGERKQFDVKPYIKGSWYGKLENPDYFRRVRTDGYTVVWPEGQDICPDELYTQSTSFAK